MPLLREINLLSHNEVQSENVIYYCQVTVFLGRYWKNLSEQTCTELLAKVPLYPVGMITFTLSAPIRILRVAGRTLLFIISFFKAIIKNTPEDWNSFKNRSILLGVSSLKLIILPFAIICPPLGYLLEEKINSLLPDNDAILYYYQKVITNEEQEEINKEYAAIFSDDATEKMSKEEALKVFKLPEGSDATEIKRSYKKLALQFHPDKNNGNTEEFKKIAAAYTALTDETPSFTELTESPFFKFFENYFCSEKQLQNALSQHQPLAKNSNSQDQEVILEDDSQEFLSTTPVKEEPSKSMSDVD